MPTTPPSVPAPGNPEGARIETAQFDFAWKWFAYHADQRVKMFNFMLVVLGIFATAAVTSVDKGMAVVAIALCGVAGTLALIFSRLDLRNECLLRLGEDAIEQLEINWLFKSFIDNQTRGSKAQADVPAILWRARTAGDNAARTRGVRTNWFHDAWAGKHRVWLRLIAYIMAALFFIAALLIFRDADSINKRSPRSDNPSPSPQSTAAPASP